MEIRQQIKEWLKENNKTQKWLAKRVNMSEATLCRWLKGTTRTKTMDDFDCIIEILKTLGYTVILVKNEIIL